MGKVALQPKVRFCMTESSIELIVSTLIQQIDSFLMEKCLLKGFIKKYKVDLQDGSKFRVINILTIMVS